MKMKKNKTKIRGVSIGYVIYDEIGAWESKSEKDNKPWPALKRNSTNN